MANPIKILVHDYTWIHLSIGLIGNATFVVGSLFFLPAFDAYRTLGVWLFITGSSLMTVGAAGGVLVEILEKEE